jgi:protein ImuA
MQSHRPDDRHGVLAELREAIRRIERRPARRGGVVPCGLEAVDAVLPDGGFPRGAISELIGGRASGKTAVALSALASLESEDLFAWIDGRGEIYPPAAAVRGVDLGRLLIVRPAGGVRGETAVQAALWASEALLGSSAFAAVVIDVPLRGIERGWDAAARRLHSAAEKGGALGLWLSSSRSAVRIPAALRIELWTEAGRVSARRSMGGVAPERRGHVA